MSDGWCPFANQRHIATDNFDFGREGQQVRAVVLHIAEGSLTGVFMHFNNPASQVSAHFCVGKKGEIDQYVSINDTAFANGLKWQSGKWFTNNGAPVNPSWQDIILGVNPNLYTISIEHEGKFTEPRTPEMHAADLRLLRWLAEETGLVFVAKRTLIGHLHINPVDKANCPGPNVDYAKIAQDTQGGEMPVDQPRDPNVDGAAKSAQTAAVARKPWMPINDGGALYKFALSKNLGYPQTDEFEFLVGADTYVGQVYNLGIVYVKKGDFGNCKFIKKP